MTSYQKLKIKSDSLQRQVDLLKQALTCYCKLNREYEYSPTDKCLHSRLTESIYVKRNKIKDEMVSKQLQYWVAENLDEKTILRLLRMKKKLNKEVK